MRKFVAVFLIVITILSVMPEVFSRNQSDYMKIIVDGKTVEARKITVLVNGIPIESDVPPILYNERTLVPIRFVENYLNAEVDWSQEKKEAKIKLGNKEVLLKIDSADVLINGKPSKLPYEVPAKLISLPSDPVNARTMVPLRFIAEAFDYIVNWEQSTYTGYVDSNEQDITGITINDKEGNVPKIIINTTGAVNHSEVHLENPYRLVVDIPNSTLNIKDRSIMGNNGVASIEVDSYPIKSIRASQFSEAPNITRLVIELEQFMGYDIKASSDNKQLEISFINKVNNIKVESINGRKAIVVYNTDSPQYNVMRLTSPDRIVLDIMDSIIEDVSIVNGLKTNFIKSVRTSQFKPDGLYSHDDSIVRVVLDVAEGIEKPNLMTETIDEKLIVYVDDEGYENVKYTNSASEGKSISIDAESLTSYTVDYYNDKNLMEIKIPKDKVNIRDGMFIVKDNFIESIIIEEDQKDKRISIEFKENINYDIMSEDKDDTIDITFTEGEKKYSDKVIIIDAGHGGKDPGTIGPITKVKEKDLNLKVALKLDEKLRSLGFKTILTRSTDVYLDLYERANIANRNDGDIFISIHHNANDKSSISGIQTLYCPAYNSEVKEEDNFPLSERIQAELLKKLNSVDRGIIKRPELVVTRETKMVAALVELGFVTNPQEEQRLITDNYQNQAVEAIANGVIRYFEEIVYKR